MSFNGLSTIVLSGEDVLPLMIDSRKVGNKRFSSKAFEVLWSGSSHGQLVLGVDRGLVIEGKIHGYEISDRG